MALAPILAGKGLDQAAAARLALAAQPLHLPAGKPVFAPGMACENYLLVAAGSVRVSTMTENGREVVLYRVGPGEACVLTTACLLAGKDYSAFGSTETEVEAYALPKQAFEELLGTSPEFRRFVFGEFGNRLTDMIVVVQGLAERHVDRRLARFLMDNSKDGAVKLTHQAIASELGTAREVVTRLLREFSDRKLVQLQRGRIVIADGSALSRLQDAL